MFKAKYKDGKIYIVLDTFVDSTTLNTYFLVWYQGWRWLSSKLFVPPALDFEDVNKENNSEQ